MILKVSSLDSKPSFYIFVVYVNPLSWRQTTFALSTDQFSWQMVPHILFTWTSTRPDPIFPPAFSRIWRFGGWRLRENRIASSRAVPFLGTFFEFTSWPQFQQIGLIDACCTLVQFWMTPPWTIFPYLYIAHNYIGLDQAFRIGMYASVSDEPWSYTWSIFSINLIDKHSSRLAF